MTEEERDDIIDLLPKNMILWDWDDELETFSHTNLEWWMKTLGHGMKSDTHTCCEACGCATTCTARAFYDSVVGSTVRELDKLGLLKEKK